MSGNEVLYVHVISCFTVTFDQLSACMEKSINFFRNYAANDLAALLLNGWLAFNRAFCSTLSQVPLKPSTSPAPLV